jgi:serine/threonine-protein kinase
MTSDNLTELTVGAAPQTEQPTPVTVSTNEGSTADSAESKLQPQRFLPIAIHAQGGLGCVSRAFDRQLEREVALKEIRPDRKPSKSSCLRFINEAKITGQLQHPGIVPIYDLEEGASPRYAMRFVAGRELGPEIKAYHAKPTRMGLISLIRRLVSVCETIAFAHNQQVIHRDLKPANIMLGDFGETLVIDWGLAKKLFASGPADTIVTDDPLYGEADLALTQPGQILGTPAYMAPEQAQGKNEEVSFGSDIFSLGAILFEILTDRPPFVGDTLYQILTTAQKGQFPTPLSINPSIPPELDSICRKATALLPNERYWSAVEMARDLERWLVDEPIACHHESIVGRWRRWARRHRIIVNTAAGILLASSIGFAFTTMMVGSAYRETDQRREEAVQFALLAQSRLQEALTLVQEVAESTQEKLGDRPQVRRELLQLSQRRLKALLANVSEENTNQQLIARIELGLGQVARYLGDIASAREHLLRTTKIIAEHPELFREPGVAYLSAEAHLDLSRFLLEGKIHDEAKEQLAKALAEYKSLLNRFGEEKAAQGIKACEELALRIARER